MNSKYVTRQSTTVALNTHQLNTRQRRSTQSSKNNSTKKQKVVQAEYLSESSEYEKSYVRDASSEAESSDPLTRIGKIYACRFRKSENVPKDKSDVGECNVNDDKPCDSKEAQNDIMQAVQDEKVTDLAESGKAAFSESKSDQMDSFAQLLVEISEDSSTQIHNPVNKNVEMEYLVQLEGDCYRKLKWFTKAELLNLAEDQAEFKLILFHRRFTQDNPNKEYSLPEQIGSNIEFLYTKIDRIIGLRTINKKKKRTSRRSVPKFDNNSNKEYLVKWKMLNYAQSTWESALDLMKTPEDIQAIETFKKINNSFKFNRIKSNKTNSIKSDSPLSNNNEIEKISEGPSYKVEGENYVCSTDTKLSLNSNLWETFVTHKVTKDGLYLPSKNRYLMSHQQNGLKWLFYNVEVKKHGSLLADEMGLGKTCQSIAFLEHLLDFYPSRKSHALVVVQKSVLENWKREFQAWAPHLNVVTLYGSREDRQIIKSYEIPWFCVDTGTIVKKPPVHATGMRNKIIKPDVLLLTYEGLRSQEFRDISNRFNNSTKWTCVIVDECQRVKSGKSSLLLQTLQQLKTETIVLLTGTPIQNSTDELFPMFTLLDPVKFTYEDSKRSNSDEHYTASKFYEKFSDIQNRDNCMELTEELHNLMAPYILRREKSIVLKTIPSKTVKLIKIPLTLIQKRVYSALYHKSIWTKGIKFSNIHMQLRKCCIHPFLIEGVESLILNGQIDSNPVKNSTDDVVVDMTESYEDRMKRLILDSSGKMILLKKILEMFKEQNRKVLIFSFFKNALDIVEDFIEVYKYNWSTERVDGDTNANERQLAIDRFNLDPKRFIFLCTTKAGGVGINLTSATVVIHLDSDFNPQNDLQAQARCHRIGQSKRVDIFYFISEHTYEDYMVFNIAGKKLGLEAVLLGRLNSNLRLNKLQEETVLRKGIFAAIRDDDLVQKDAIEFAQSSIDSILNTKSVTLLFDESKPETHKKEEEATVAGSTTEEALLEINEINVQRVVYDDEDDTANAADASDSEVDEHQPDFWIRVANRLKPFNINKQEPKELTRADRRRNKNVNYRENMYQSMFLKEDQVDFDEEDDDDEEDGYEEEYDEEEDNNMHENFKELYPEKARYHSSGKYMSSEKADNSSEDSSVDSQEYRAAEASKKKPKLNTADASAKSSAAADVTINIADQKEFWLQWLKEDVQHTHYGHKFVPEIASVLELLYRCIRACQCWKAINPDDSVGIRTDTIRCIDRAAPWAVNIKYANTPSSEFLLSQTWQDVLTEWKTAGLDWKNKQSAILNHWSKVVMAKKTDYMKCKWAQKILPEFTAMSNYPVEQSEVQNLALMTHGTQILNELQAICDEAAKTILTGRYFSREFTLKKQTWIAAENLFIKLIFIHLIAQQFVAGSQLPTNKVMVWPLKATEINWAIMTEVIKRLNRYTGGAERRQMAIKERFYNKLDSRWNHGLFSSEERNILSAALANNIQPYVVAENLPGRTLEKIKKALRSPDIIKKCQAEPVYFESTSNINATFLKFCEPYVKSFAIENNLEGLNPIFNYKQCGFVENTYPRNSRTDFFECLPNTPDTDLLEKIQEVLLSFGVHPEEFRRLQLILTSQSVCTLTNLLKQLKLLSLCQKPNLNPFIESVINKSLPNPSTLGISNYLKTKKNMLNMLQSKIVISQPPKNEEKTQICKNPQSLTSQLFSFSSNSNLF